MSSRRWHRQPVVLPPSIWWRFALLSAAVTILAACWTVRLEPPPEEAPLFRRIDARVGIVYTAAARTAIATNLLWRIEVGKTSVARFQQVFSSMFAHAVELPDWPPWREVSTGLDGVIELERAEAELVLGNDAGRALGGIISGNAGRPDVVSIAYRVCLYEPGGAEIRCWSPSARYSHQRSIGECLDLRACLVPETESAIREAIAQFMVDAEGDQVLQAWSARVGGRGTKP
jgi:hypothetical protein